MLDNMSVGQTLDWDLPEHDKQFEENLISDLINYLDSKKKQVNNTKSGRVVISYFTRKRIQEKFTL